MGSGYRLCMKIVPINQKEAQTWVREHHRHHKPPVGSIFQIGAQDNDGNLCAVAIVGRPVARKLDDGRTLEVTRVAIREHEGELHNVASMLYGACARAGAALGYGRIYTYTLASESGGSLRASGWIEDGETLAKEWSNANRPRGAGLFPELVNDWQGEAKTRWRRDLR